MHMVTIPISNAIIIFLNFMPIMSSANNLFKHFGPSSDPTFFQARSGSLLSDTYPGFPEKSVLKKKKTADNKNAKLPSLQ